MWSRVSISDEGEVVNAPDIIVLFVIVLVNEVRVLLVFYFVEVSPMRVNVN